MSAASIYRVPALIVNDAVDDADILAAIGNGDCELLARSDRYDGDLPCNDDWKVNACCSTFIAEEGDIIVLVTSFDPSPCLNNDLSVTRFEMSYQGPTTAEPTDL